MTTREFTLVDAIDRAQDLGEYLVELSSVLDRSADGIEANGEQGMDTSECAVRIMHNAARQLRELTTSTGKLHSGLKELHGQRPKVAAND